MMDAKVKILFFSADDHYAYDDPLSPTREYVRVFESLESTAAAAAVVMEFWPHVKITTLNHRLSTCRPNVVHLSGRGTPSGEFWMRDQNDNPRPMTATGLAKIVAEQRSVGLVVLNGCYTIDFARELHKIRPDVIVVGMEQSIGVEECELFSVGFYQSLGQVNGTVRSSYKMSIAMLEANYGNGVLAPHRTPCIFPAPHERSNVLDVTLEGLARPT